VRHLASPASDAGDPRTHVKPTELEKEESMLRLRTWAFRYALLAAFVLAAGAGFKWGA
jgi:hypothetical protein